MKNLHVSLFTIVLIFFSFLSFSCNAKEVTQKEPELNYKSLDIFKENTTGFAIDLYKQIKDDDGNLFFSPFSLSMLMGMLYVGAKGETENQIATIMQYKQPRSIIYKSFDFYGNSKNNYGKTRLNVSNGIWIQDNFKVIDSFKAVVAKYFYAKLNDIDFQNKQLSTALINKWASDNSNGLVKNVISSDQINADTRMVLANLIYFKGIWRNKFKPENTKEGIFYLDSGSTVNTKFMNQKEEHSYYQDDQLQFLELRYDGKYEMNIILPRKKDGLAEIEDSLTVEKFNKWKKETRYKRVKVILPSFKLSTDYDMKKMLLKMGLQDAFTNTKADFSGIVKRKKNKNLYISDIIQKAYIDVNEEGTEASAYSSATAGVYGAGISDYTVYEFKADHPFMFVILRDNIIFMGRVLNPAE